jgi:hypothetical protein
MGGLSTGKFIVEKVDGVMCYRMTGDVTTKNNGGFIQIRAKLSPEINSKDYDGVYVKVYGNEKNYNLHLRTGLTLAPWQYYIKSVGLVAGFDDFKSDICLSEIGFY